MVGSISAAVEGPIDEAVVTRILDLTGLELGRVYGRLGKDNLRRRIQGFNHAAEYSPWLVVVDLDRCECAPVLARRWLPAPSTHMCFRVAVREVEAWLLADRVAVAQFLGVSRSLIPGDPDSLDDPKEALVNLARRSRFRSIRNDLVPQEGSGRGVGPAYTTEVTRYVAASWRPEIAADTSPSLRRCIQRVSHLS